MKALILISLLIIHCNCYGCDCNSIAGLYEAKSVFKGEVVAVKNVNDSGWHTEITFKIFEVIKGEIKSNFFIVDSPNCPYDACCGIPFKVNDKYIVYTVLRVGYKHEFVNICTETKLLP
jgi:hypothetical protein